MKCTALSRCMALLIVLSVQLCAGDSENTLTVRATMLNHEIGKIGLNLELAQGADVVAQQIRSDLSNLGNPGRKALRALFLTVVHSKVDRANIRAVPIFESIVSFFEKASENSCWSDLEATRLRNSTNEVYGGMAQWIKSLREMMIVSYVDQVIPPPTLPDSISSTYFGDIPEPSMVKDHEERDAYSKQYQVYRANEQANILQRNLPGIIAKAELALFSSMKTNPSKDIVDAKFILQILEKAGASKERIAQLNKSD